MLCDKCKKNEATTYYKSNINGQITEQHLCSECAKEAGITGGFTWLDTGFPTFGSMLSGLFGDPVKSIGEPASSDVCPTCHTTMDEIARTGKVGCADCYGTFSGMLMPYIRRIHGNANHTGRTPSRVTVSPNKKIRQLEQELAAVIAAQKYERAAEIRDELKQLKGAE